jgi:hypothetical protein
MALVRNFVVVQRPILNRAEQDSAPNLRHWFGRKATKEMSSLKAMLANRRSGQAGALLKGSDVPEGITTITIVIDEVRQAPEDFNAPVIIVLKKEVYGKTAWAVNKTNLKLLIKLFGDSVEKLIGKKLKLVIITVQNPQTGEMVPSLAVSPKQ